MDSMQESQKFNYLAQKKRIIEVQLCLTIMACIILVIWNLCLLIIGPLPVIFILLTNIPVAILIVAAGQKFLRKLLQKGEQGECIQRGKSAFLKLEGMDYEIELDDIIEIGIYDSRRDSKGILIDIFNEFALETSLTWLVGLTFGTICLEIKTKTNNYKFVDMPEEKSTPVEYNGLYKTMRLIKNTYKMKEKRDHRGIVLYDIYVAG
ncbi:MAG: hypothetical protein ACOX4R_04105 [Lentihominibacter sp.]|jgi:hypothetical protein